MKKLILIICVCLFFSCENEDKQEIIQTLIIASETKDCTGSFQQKCFLIKEQTTDTDWSLFYNSIQGFEYERGYEYVVRVSRTYLQENVNLADSSLYEYSLLEIVSKEQKDSDI